MFVGLTALVVSLAYLTAIPVKLAFVITAKSPRSFGIGISIFEARFARRIAEKHLLDEKKQKPPAKLNIEKLPAIRSGLHTMRYVLRHLKIDQLSAEFSLGLGDAAATALTCGALNSLICAIGAVTGATLCANITPNFSGYHFEGHAEGMLTLRAGHIILAALIGAFDYGNGRLTKWIDTRSKTS